MPQVPYNPIPDVGPRDDPTPEIRINANPDAFGANIGEALKGLGTTGQHVGDELFQRALALQQLQNETVAKQADTDYMIKAGELHANFSALEGKDAVAAYPKFAKDLQDARNAIRDSLGTDNARKMFDAQSLTTMGRSIFNGAGHAATEQKKWSTGVADSRIQAVQDGIYANPTDEVAVARGEADVTNEIRSKADLKGWDEEQTQREIDRALSSSRALRIAGLARTDPNGAKDMFEKYKPSMTAKDSYNTEQIVQRQMYTTGARIIAGNLTKSLFDPDRNPTDPETPLSELVAQARDMARKQMPNDPLFEDYATKATESLFNQYKQIKVQENQQARQSVESAMLGLNNPNGKIPASMDELRADPEAAKAFDQLQPTQKKAVLAQLAKNSKGDVIETPERRDNFLTLRGMAITEPAKFQDIMLSTQDITNARKVELTKMSQGIDKLQQDSLVQKVGSAMRSLDGQLNDAQITLRGDPAQYYKFKGALWGEIEGYRETYKKLPSDDEVGLMGAKLLRDDASRKWYQSSQKEFEVDIPEAHRKTITDAYIADHGVVPPEADIRRIYFRKQMKDYYDQQSKPK